MLRRSGQKPLNSSAEQLRLGELPINHPSFRVVAGRVLATSPQLLAEKDVLNPGFSKSHLQFLAPELRVEAAIGDGSDVRYGCDGMLLEQAEENLDGVVRMSDAIDHTASGDLARTRNTST